MWYLGHTLLPHRDGQPFLPQLNAFPLHLPPAPGGLLVLLGLWQGPSCRFVCESWATRHLLFSLKSFSENKEPVWSSAAVAKLLDLTDHQGSADHLLATAGLMSCLPCPESVCVQLFEKRTWCGQKEILCILQATPCPPLHRSMGVMCEGGGSPGRCGPLQALGLRTVCWGSSLHPCSRCLSRCQNSVLLQDLNFWKLIKTCLLWWGQGLLDVDPALCLAPLSLPVEHKDWIW